MQVYILRAWLYYEDLLFHSKTDWKYNYPFRPSIANIRPLPNNGISSLNQNAQVENLFNVKQRRV